MRATTPVHAALGLSAAVTMAVLLALAPAAAPSSASHASEGRSPLAGLQAAATEAPTGTLSCVPPPNGMVAWWRFEQAEGGDPPPAYFRDLAGVNNSALSDAAPAQSVGWVGTGLHLDGESQFLAAADHPELDLGTGDFTIDAWVRLSPDATGIRTIVDKRTFDPVRGYALFTSEGNLMFQLGDGSAPGNVCSSDPTTDPCTNYNSNTAINDGLWHFVAVIVPRSGGAHFIVDGAVIPFNAALRPLSLDNAAPLRIGKHADEGGLWKGDIDEVEMFDRALDDSELASIFAAGPVGKCSPEGSLRGHSELVNIDATNPCTSNATGFQFTLSDFLHANYDANSAHFSFETVFEQVCPSTTTLDCNPFTPSQAKATYGPASIELAWLNPVTPRIVPPNGKAHFGYTLTAGDNDTFHTIKASWRLESGASCYVFGDSILWAAPSMPPLGNDSATKIDQSPAVGVTIRNPSPMAMQATVRGFGSANQIALEDLLSSNRELWRMAGEPLTSVRLAPREAVSVSVPIDLGNWGVVVITDWSDGQTNEPRGRSFHARPLAAWLSPTVTPSATPEATPVTTSLPPDATPSLTPLPPTETTTPMPSQAPTGSADQTATVDIPEPTPPGGSATPNVRWRLFLPVLKLERD